MAMGDNPSGLPSLLSSLLSVLALLFASAGVRLCCGHAPRARWLEACAAALFCLQMYCFFVRRSPMSALLIHSMLLMLIGIYTAVPLLREAPEGDTFANRYTAMVFLLGFGVPELMFGLAVRHHPAASYGLFNNTVASLLFCLSTLLSLVGLAFGYFLLTNERLMGELRTANELLREETEELLLVQKQLARSERSEAIGRLAGGISHIFNNQMCIIQLYCEQLLDSPELPESVRSSVKRISDAGERSAEITARLLQFARSNPLKNSNFDITRWLPTLTNDLKRVLGEAIEMEITSTVPKANVFADADQLAGVMLALAANARHAMPSGGNWTLLVEELHLAETGKGRELLLPRGDYISLSATDMGCGMDEETVKRIFEPFYSTKSLAVAEGLGLASAFGLAQQSGGTMSAESTLGAGTTIRLYLPKAASTPY
jgi:signal transduction histidine kinase